MLVLFDIDGTLVSTGEAGMRAVGDAWRAIFASELSYDRALMPGNLDPLIWRHLCEANGVLEHQQLLPRFRSLYSQELKNRLERANTVRSLPGVESVLARIAGRSDLTLGLLTGNFPETGRLKVEYAGLDPQLFAVAAWGDDGCERRHLPPVAMQRYEALTGHALGPEEVVIIGDTPNDVDCARANGCRSLAVATGLYSLVELERTGADHVRSDLSETDEIVNWILAV